MPNFKSNTHCGYKIVRFPSTFLKIKLFPCKNFINYCNKCEAAEDDQRQDGVLGGVCI